MQIANNPFPISGLEPAQLEAALKELNTDLGTVGLWYCYDFALPEQWYRQSTSRKTVIRRFAKRRRLFASSGPISELWHQQSSHYHKMADVIQGVWQQEIYVWPMAELSDTMFFALDRMDVNALVTFTVGCPLANEFRGRFTLLLNKSSDVSRVLDKRHGILSRLENTQQAFSYRFAKTLNPLVDYNIVNPLSVYILGLLASGNNRPEIAQQLRLSRRGVDYHLATLKDLLDTKSIHQLVYRATQLQLI
ncbi:LuxR C-terminal-related transcriptional regulator [Ferrimonas balearica]|uniref:LuxR C-terminal-related transcriptional regulator n=1 Tax=Ferrimonas balearica TaxID=44012 RepID=UPI001F40C53D|nr:LuxR C-terminal-related transcriptional regulator [Ferrimonas balearica]MBY6019734.1 LuxR C-terminal-related transcriptional regulator [Halomonas denitrificans]MBY6096800.1 LuxR C-terminal-related transcriptional regulator [Ferrimonas balearica]